MNIIRNLRKLARDTLEQVNQSLINLVSEKNLWLPPNFNYITEIKDIAKKIKSDISPADMDEVMTEVLLYIWEFTEKFEIGEEDKYRYGTYIKRLLWQKVKSAIDDLKPVEEIDAIDFHLIEDLHDTFADEEAFKELALEAEDYLGRKDPKAAKVFSWILDGFSRQEIIDKLKVSQGYITQLLNRIKDRLIDFATVTVNEPLRKALISLEGYYKLSKLSYIRKTRNKEEWCVYSEKGKNLGCYPSKEKAKKRLQQVHFFESQGSTTLIKNLRYLSKELS